MAETKLSIKGKVFVQLDGSDEQYEVGTVEIPFNVNFAEGRVNATIHRDFARGGIATRAVAPDPERIFQPKI